MKNVWFSVFLVWMVKIFILRYGGGRIYEKFKGFFLGLVMGQFAIMNVWLIVNSITESVGQRLFHF